MSKKKKIWITVLLLVLALIIVPRIFTVFHKSDPKNVVKTNSENQYISDEVLVSAHRSGAGIMPEETMMAFKNCVESKDFHTDIFEFDLHITKDDVLVLLHDDTLERTSDCEEVLNDKKARPENYTYEELRQLNLGHKFESEDGKKPFEDLKGESVPDDLKIARVEDVLDYLTSKGDFQYIIEIKNDGELGCKGVDILYNVLKERNLTDKTIFGTFHEEVSFYVDENYSDLKRSATIKEAVAFYFSALTDKDDFEAKYVALQIPYGTLYNVLGVNTGWTAITNYAHKNDIAVQYWTINDEKDMKYLSTIGADCIMSDYPNKTYEIIHSDEKSEIEN